ncbi:MAG: AsmA family protein [Alphaproteobacteria bacterium]|nr:AsmA family protein [Alphaproteobacteria bacterium]
MKKKKSRKSKKPGILIRKRGAKILRLLKRAALARRRRIWFIIRACALAFGIFVLSLAITLSKIDLDMFREEITAGLRAATGLPVEIQGDVSWNLSLRPRATLTDVRVKNADWATRPYGARIDSIVVTFDLFSVFSGRPAIEELRLVNMWVSVEENEQGKFSIDRAPPAHDFVGPDESFPFDLNLGFETIELINPRIEHITPKRAENFAAQRARITYRRHPDGVEYTGFLVRYGVEKSFVLSFSELDAERRTYPARVAIAGRTAQLVAYGALDAESKIPTDFTVSGSVIDLKKIGTFLRLDFPEVPRFNVNMAGGMERQKIVVRRADLRSGNNDISLVGNFDWRGRVPLLSMRLSGNNINLKQIAPDIYRPEYPPWVRPADRELNVFKDTPIYPELLRLADIDLVLDFGNITVYRELAIRDLIATASVKDGVATVRANAEMGGGDVTGVAKAHEQDGVLYARAAGRGDNIVVGDLLAELRTHNFLTGLPSGFEFYLESRGGDLLSLMSNINGQVIGASTGRGRALRDAQEYLYGRDFLTSLRDGVTGFVRRNNEEIMRINCAAVNLKIRDGRVETERGVAVETSEVNIRAEGYVDLGRETLRASMVTTPVRGLKISVSGNVVNSMEVRGNLAEPDLRVSRGTVVNRAVTATGIGLVLAPFTGGLSIPAGAAVGLLASDILTNWLADDTPCRTAIERGAPSRRGDPEFMRRPLSENVNEMFGE